MQLLSDQLNLGEISWQDYQTAVAKETGGRIDDVHAKFIAEHLNPRLLDYIKGLKNRFKTAILSNSNKEFFGSLTSRTALDEYFDEIILSADLGIIKPDPRIYEYALEKLQVRPQETIFVDDLAKYTQAAGQLGVKTIVYSDFGRFKIELERILQSAPTDNQPLG